MLQASNIHYEMGERGRGLAMGGIGAMHRLVVETGLADAINEKLHVLKRHLPYWESDHVLNVAYNVLAGGRCLEDIELLRNDEVYLDALGAERIPDPTTEGDFCRRFESREPIEALMGAINEVRVRVWKQQPEEFFEEAVIDADGTMAPTTGECKEGMDISHKGEWGYHPLVVTLANTGEALYLENAPSPKRYGASATGAGTVRRTRGRRHVWTRPSRCAGVRGSGRCSCEETRTSARRRIWTGGTARGCGSCSALTPSRTW